MANDLVRWARHMPDGGLEPDHDDTLDENEQWNTPPDQPANTRRVPRYRSSAGGGAAEAADRDAADARARGDNTFAALREEDAADHRQTFWDWGDLRTWTWIIGMCVGFLVFSAFCYYLPQGRHNQADTPSIDSGQPGPTPTIRVY
jgi:hypothetical protein